MLDVIGNPPARPLHDGLLHRPQPREHHLRTLRLQNRLHLLVVHHVACQTFIVSSHHLHIHTYGMVADGADDGLLAMTQVEVDVGTPDYRGLPMLTIFKNRLLRDSIYLAQPFAKQHVGGSTSALAQLVLVLERHLPTLVGELQKRLVQVEVVDMVVDEDGGHRLTFLCL